MYQVLEPLRLFGRVFGLIMGSNFSAPIDETLKHYALYQISEY
jgi:hypothetical protein